MSDDEEIPYTITTLTDSDRVNGKFLENGIGISGPGWNNTILMKVVDGWKAYKIGNQNIGVLEGMNPTMVPTREDTHIPDAILFIDNEEPFVLRARRGRLVAPPPCRLDVNCWRAPPISEDTFIHFDPTKAVLPTVITGRAMVENPGFGRSVGFAELEKWNVNKAQEILSKAETWSPNALGGNISSSLYDYNYFDRNTDNADASGRAPSSFEDTLPITGLEDLADVLVPGDIIVIKKVDVIATWKIHSKLDDRYQTGIIPDSPGDIVVARLFVGQGCNEGCPTGLVHKLHTFDIYSDVGEWDTTNGNKTSIFVKFNYGFLGERYGPYTDPRVLFDTQIGATEDETFEITKLNDDDTSFWSATEDDFYSIFNPFNYAEVADDATWYSPIIHGCTIPRAVNYNPAAGFSVNRNCVIPGCEDPDALNFDPLATRGALPDYPDRACYYKHGCMDPGADNYDRSATRNATTEEEGMCYYVGCTDPGADNYDRDATRNATTEEEGMCYYKNKTFYEKHRTKIILLIVLMLVFIIYKY